ncbi:MULTISPECIES: RagB/SusD family nutrient uptake outer membrane protein [Gelidibacter]|uniref:RagB/SusD family nutrient uptake outer membrane protein n=1 Tax=Gelidibacter maritimus TaxID=2761487 RepID=A0A7W2M6Z8_9FLAO|nr:RagB/SusD family nutrient uptake outer membrane protein [Gelidibacter maritimus]MBA6153845.1 RagB/SusD family nutrient uptake outer membrane protein [Gelidibacter maritimus]
MKKYFILLISTVLVYNCESFTDINLPDNQLTGKVVFEDVQTADAALTHVYTLLFSETLVTGNQRGIGVLMGAYGDEQTYHTTEGFAQGVFFLNQVAPNDNTIMTLWDKSYHAIYALNAIIEGVEKSNITETDKNKLLGEAYFTRAYIHYFLYGLFDEIPYITSTDYELNSKTGKLKPGELIDALQNDLERAAQFLKNVPQHVLKGRPSIDAVKVLQARTALLQQDWDSVIRLTSEIIDSNHYSLETDLNLVFLKESTETIWQLMAKAGNNAMEGASYIFTKIPPVQSMSESLYNSFEISDLRKTHWTKTLSNETQSFTHSFKYKYNQPTGTSMEYSVQLRLAEVYLMRAEAYIQSGQTDMGLDDINMIRQRAGLENRMTASEQTVLQYLIEERQHELFSEHGHRFFDLKRWDKLDEVLSNVKPNWQTAYKNLPLPEKELLLNPNLNPQNNGY